MATPFDGGPAFGATSSDRDNAPCRPEIRPRRLFNRPVIALAVDDSVPARHRSRRNRAAHPAQVSEERLGFFASTSLAVISLVFVSVVALGLLLTSTAIPHLAYPNGHVDAFRAMHEPLMVGLLFGLGVLWLLPPHPWQAEPARREPKKRRVVRAKAAV